MYRPVGLNRLYVKSLKRQNRKVPRTLITLFTIFTFVFGLDLGFIGSFDRRIHRAAKLFSRIISLFVIFVLFVPLMDGKKDYYWVTLVFMQYIFYCITVMMIKYTLYDFFLALYNIEENITRLNQERIGLASWMYCFLIIFSKTLLTHFYCQDYFPENCTFDFIPLHVYVIFSQAVDLMSLIPILIYYMLYCCIKHLNEMLEGGASVEDVKNVYIEIANCYDKVRPLYNALLSLEILHEVPKLLGVMWNLLKEIQDDMGWFVYFDEGLYAFHTVMFIICNAAMVQITASQVTALKLKLYTILVDENNAKSHDPASRLVLYLESRRLQHELVGVLPVDMRLAASVLDMCSTYMVVVVQFTHLYD